jgi:hypothetical protein
MGKIGQDRVNDLSPNNLGIIDQEAFAEQHYALQNLATSKGLKYIGAQLANAIKVLGNVLSSSDLKFKNAHFFGLIQKSSIF